MAINQSSNSDKDTDPCKGDIEVFDPVVQVITQSLGLSDDEKQQFIIEANQALDDF